MNAHFETKKLILNRLLTSSEKTNGMKSRKTWAIVTRLSQLLEEVGDQNSQQSLLAKYQSNCESAVSLSCFALEWCYAGRPSMAESLFHQAISIETKELPKSSIKHPHRLFNLTIALIMQQKLDKAKKALAQAWQYQTGRHDAISARLLIEFIAVSMLEKGHYKSYVPMIKPLLCSKGRHFEGNISPVTQAATFIDYLGERFSQSEREFLHALFRAANDPEEVSALDTFPAWKEAPAMRHEDLDHVFV